MTSLSGTRDATSTAHPRFTSTNSRTNALGSSFGVLHEAGGLLTGRSRHTFGCEGDDHHTVSGSAVSQRSRTSPSGWHASRSILLTRKPSVGDCLVLAARPPGEARAYLSCHKGRCASPHFSSTERHPGRASRTTGSAGAPERPCAGSPYAEACDARRSRSGATRPSRRSNWGT